MFVRKTKDDRKVISVLQDLADVSFTMYCACAMHVLCVHMYICLHLLLSLCHTHSL